MTSPHHVLRSSYRAALLLASLGLVACQSPQSYREEADRVAYRIIQAGQQDAYGYVEPFTIETPEQTLRRRLTQTQGLVVSEDAALGTDQLTPLDHWPDDDYLTRQRTEDDATPIVPALKITLTNALQIAANNSRQYQLEKENVYLAALTLDLERDDFRTVFAGMASSFYEADLGADPTVQGIRNTGDITATQRFQNGITASTGIAIDLARLLFSGDDQSSAAVALDATITVPLLAGAGEHIVTESLKQAERDVLYALWDFDRFRREFAVRVASDYLNVLQQLDRIKNARANYIRLIESQIESQARLDADRLSRIQLDQVTQDVLRARTNWISAREGYASQLDRFKNTLGLPTDAVVELEYGDLSRLADLGRERLGGGLDEADDIESEYTIVDGRVELLENRVGEVVGPLELPEDEAVALAFEHRQDLKVTQGRVVDAMREIVVDADALRAGLTLVMSGGVGESRSLGSARSDNGQIRFERGDYSIGFEFDLPWEKTSERNAYRRALIDLERSVRNLQELEDQVKIDVRDALRSLREARENIRIQLKAVDVAQRRVDSTREFFEAGRSGVQIRDILEAEDDLVSAQNDLTSALVDYRVRELQLQRDMGVLKIDDQGMWQEYRPGQASQEIGDEAESNT